MNLARITRPNAMKAVPYVTGVKNGSRKTQKDTFQANLVRASGSVKPCFCGVYSVAFFRSHANRVVVWNSSTSQKKAPKIARPIRPPRPDQNDMVTAITT